MSRCFFPCPACLQDLFDGAEQPVAVGKHHVVKFVAVSSWRDVRAFERFEIKLDRGDRRFQLVRDRVEKCVVLFVAAYLADEKYRVQDQARLLSTAKKMMPKTSNATSRRLSKIQPIFSATASADRQMPRMRKNIAVLRRRMLSQK